MNLFNELKRRNVFRMGIAYVVVAWVLLQAIDFVLDVIAAPDWVLQVFLLAAVAGLPIVLIFSWVFEITPEGIKRESEVDRSHSITRHTGHKLDRTIITFLALAVILLLGERFISGRETPDPTQATAVAEEQSVSTTPVEKDDKRSLAVLPFVNMSSDPEQEYFSDGLAEELLNRLAQNSKLQVAARTSSFQFKDRNQDIGEIGRQLKVDNVLEGSVRKSGNRLRITAQLIRVDSGFHLWSETFEREMDDIFAVQDDIAQAISSALEAELGAGSTQVENQLTDNMEAYQAYLKGRYLLNKRGPDNLLKAHEQFEKATRLDPGFAKAWADMAFNYSLLPAYSADITSQQAWKIVRVAADKALELDPENAEAYVALARSDIEDDLQTIHDIYEKAYELGPRNPDVVNLYGDFLQFIGDFKAAERVEREAVELDPLAAVQHTDMANLLYMFKRNEEGLNYGRTSASLEPDSAYRVDPLISGLILTGQYDEAEKLIKSFEQRSDSAADIVNQWWCLFFYQLGDEQNLRTKLSERLAGSSSGTGNFDLAVTAFFLTWLDGTDAAMPTLQAAYDADAVYLKSPLFFYLPEDVSDDPEWLAFWQQPGLAELIEIRRQHKTQTNIGLWKARPGQ
jgi:TolB-like protein/cytochrome c-type biogenesis protein CcmH/NrfG